MSFCVGLLPDTFTITQSAAITAALLASASAYFKFDDVDASYQIPTGCQFVMGDFVIHACR